LSELIRNIGSYRDIFIVTIYIKVSLQTLSAILAKTTGYPLPLEPLAFQGSDQTSFEKDYDKIRNAQDIIGPLSLSIHIFDLGRAPAQVIPIQCDNDQIAEGVSGCVYKARIDSDYRYITDLSPDSTTPKPNKFVAIKKMTHRSRQVKSHAEAEISFAKKLAKHCIHEHIMKSYAAFDIEQPYVQRSTYLISECATTHLKDILEKMTPSSDPKKKQEGVKWWRCQIFGLANALAWIHAPKAGDVGCHHDIKPLNILAFSREEAKGPTLKFSDWGTACFREYNGQPPSPPHHKQGVFPYLPPEYVSGNATSRPHDIWSLGCVFVELLVWFCEGNAMYKQFMEDVKDSSNNTDSCWFVTGQNSLTKSLENKLRDLHGRENGKWASLVDVIQKMFEIDPGERITAGDLVDGLRTPM
jgi:serine/threonine protein kinase